MQAAHTQKRTLFKLPVQCHFIEDYKIILLQQTHKNFRLKVTKISCFCHKLQVPLYKVLAHLEVVINAILTHYCLVVISVMLVSHWTIPLVSS